MFLSTIFAEASLKQNHSNVFIYGAVLRVGRAVGEALCRELSVACGVFYDIYI